MQAHDAYLVKFDGSGRVSKRNRKFLRPITPYNNQLLGTPRNIGGNPQNLGGPNSGYLTPQDNQSLINIVDNFDNSNNLGTAGTRAWPDPRERAQYQPAPDQDASLQDPGPSPERESTPGPSYEDAEYEEQVPSPPRRQAPQDPALRGAVLRQDHPYVSSQPASPDNTELQRQESAVYTSLPAAQPSANHGRPQSTRSAEPQPSPPPHSEPQPRRGLRVRFKPQPLVVGDPKHPYWQAHHSRPRIPPVRGEGR